MGLFKKKSDPVSERARALNDQIAALEAEIRKLAEVESSSAPPASASFAPARASPPTPVPAPVPTEAKPQPRLRSTVRPQGPAAQPNPFTNAVIEERDHPRIETMREAGAPKHESDLGTRKYDLRAAWQRFKTHFSGPSTSNPKLVNYLAAGSVQGLRPLRYEKRVARNRLFLLLAGLFLALWGLFYIIFGHR